MTDLYILMTDLDALVTDLDALVAHHVHQQVVIGQRRDPACAAVQYRVPGAFLLLRLLRLLLWLLTGPQFFSARLPHVAA